MKKIIISLFLMLCLGGCSNIEPSPTIEPTAEITPIPTPTVTPLPTPNITPIPTPAITDHPDLHQHYTTREDIEGYKKMSESEIQKMLDMYDAGFDDGYDLGRDDSYWEVYEESYEEGYQEGSAERG